jgi:hypothetical protein
MGMLAPHAGGLSGPIQLVLDNQQGAAVRLPEPADGLHLAGRVAVNGFLRLAEAAALSQKKLCRRLLHPVHRPFACGFPVTSASLRDD